MSARIIGRIGGNAGRLKSIEAEPLPLSVWQASTTATSSFTATSHSLGSAMTSTMGNELVTVAIQPVATDTVIDVETKIIGTATGGSWAAGMFYGTASHPFNVSTFSNGAGVDELLTFSPSTRHLPGATATASISVRLVGSAANTFYFNSSSSSQTLGGQVTSNIRIIERRP